MSPCVHELFCRGSRVRIRSEGDDARIEVLTDPAVLECPYVEAVYGISRVDREAVKRILRMKIETLGMFTGRRKFPRELFVPFGSSEIMSVAVERGLIEGAIVVCEGAGTVICRDPGLIQGIGARMNGLISTCPIKGIIERIEETGGAVLDPESASIDQVEGLRVAAEMGMRRVAVTIIGARSWEIPEIRRVSEELGVEAIVFSTCNTVTDGSASVTSVGDPM